MIQNWILPPDMKTDGIIYSFRYVTHGQLRMNITGCGVIPGKDGYQPWVRYQDKISELWIGEGVTAIGAYAFEGYELLERVWLPESVQELGCMAFCRCPKLHEITYSGSIQQLQRVIMVNALPEQFYRKEEANAL